MLNRDRDSSVLYGGIVVGYRDEFVVAVRFA